MSSQSPFAKGGESGFSPLKKSKINLFKDQRDSFANFKYSSEDQNPRVFDIEDLLQATKFSKSEIQFIYRDFKIVIILNKIKI